MWTSGNLLPIYRQVNRKSRWPWGLGLCGSSGVWKLAPACNQHLVDCRQAAKVGLPCHNGCVETPLTEDKCADERGWMELESRELML